MVDCRIEILIDLVENVSAIHSQEKNLVEDEAHDYIATKHFASMLVTSSVLS